MEKKLTILVTGATGTQGGAVVNALLKKRHKVKALTRHPDSEKVLALESKGVTIIKGSFDEKETLNTNLKGLDGIFIMSTPYERGVEAEVRQGRNIIDAAINAGVRHIVFSSVANADKNTGIPHFESKYQLEQYLSQQRTVPFSIIAPAFFFDNFITPFLLPGLKKGFFYQALPPGIPLESVSADSIGEFAVFIFENHDTFTGKRIDIAEDNLTGTEYAEILSKTSGKQIEYVELAINEVRKNSKDLALMYEWFKNTGYSVDINALKKRFPQIKWKSFKEWAQKQDWKHLLNGSLT
ncbi:MAG: NmrA/HSCARG family protein [Spirochaetales bacterium]|nr:NmrA/HSCARG family protein [Spirochaetales bacterium]